MKRYIFIIVGFLLIGVASGYSIGYMKYEPRIKGYEIQVSDLTYTLSSLRQATYNQASRISNLESEKSSLQTGLSRAQEQLQDHQEQLTAVKSQLSDSMGRLNRMLSLIVIQHYEWVYPFSTWKWDLDLPLSVYFEYVERPRPQSLSYYVNLARDPQDDQYIDQIVEHINNAALQERFSRVEKLNFVVAFIQSLPYTEDSVTTPYDEYARYPIETLFDRGGDCEDTSILAAALLDRLGYDVAILVLENARHIAVGVSIPGAHGFYYEYEGKRYYYLETTGEGWAMGQIPPDISDTEAHIYPLRS
jgi:hypothetical protein